MNRIAIIVLLCLFAGCSNNSESAVASKDEPISVEAWKELEVAEKYEPETLDRLKLNDPKLKNERNWNRFMRDVVVPERRIDIPTDY
ncbi:MAG: hypothetical protein AAFN77_02990 [Planctomycetota bacterium]